MCKEVGRAVRIHIIHNVELNERAGTDAETAITTKVIQGRQNVCVKSCNSTQNCV